MTQIRSPLLLGSFLPDEDAEDRGISTKEAFIAALENTPLDLDANILSRCG